MKTETCNTLIYPAAESAARSLLHRLDKNEHHRPFFNIAVRDGIMRAEHASWDCVDMTGRFTDAWILARQMFDWPMTEEEEAVRRYLLSTQNPEDGLCYDRECEEPGTADMFCQSRALLGLVSWFLESGDSAIQDRIEMLAEGLWNVAAKQDDFCYYPGHRYSPGGWLGVSAYSAKDLGPTALPAYGVLQILPLTRYLEATGSSAARRLVEGLIRFFVQESGVIQPDGSFRGHLHSWGILPSTVGVLRYAMLSGSDDLIPWCKRVYDFVVRNSSSFGWVPDGIGAGDGIETGETCCITDLIHLGVKLAECGFDECLDFVEAMARNQLLENQIRDTRRFRFESAEVEAMTLGTYDSWVMPNGLTGCSELGLEGCCTASAVRAAYLVWKHAIAASGNEVRVNLMLSRKSEWLDALDHQPLQGRFSLLIHRAATVLIRVPGWVRRENVTLRLDGMEASPEWAGAFLRIHGTPNMRVEMEFPLAERRSQEEILGQAYQLHWIGSTLMRIDPPGEIYPIFRRTLDDYLRCNGMVFDRLHVGSSVDW